MSVSGTSTPPVLIATDGKGYRLDKNELFIGRSNDCDIVIDDPRASRRHARIFQHGDYLWLEDLDSRNGIVLNGEKLVGNHILKDSYEFVIAGMQFRLFDPNSTLGDNTAPDLQIKAEAREVRLNGRELELTQKERSLLWLLFQFRGEVRTKQEIALAVWPEYTDVSDYNIEGLVSRLRGKIEKDAKDPQLIVTVRGVGYKLV